MLVGHEPYLSRLIALLTAGETGVAIDLKKGGLGKLEAESLHYGRCATLVWLLTPRQMELMTNEAVSRRGNENSLIKSNPKLYCKRFRISFGG